MLENKEEKEKKVCSSNGLHWDNVLNFTKRKTRVKMKKRKPAEAGISHTVRLD